MTYTYTWTDAAQSSLRREDEAGNVAFVPVAEGNRDYAEFVASGAVATAYVAPAYVAPEPTPFDLLEARVAALEADHAAAMGNMNGGGY
jgi:hypothetical protein